MASAEPVELFFDFLSPYAYLVHHRIRGLVEDAGRQVVLRPVLLAALLNHHGTRGPAEVPAKRIYVFKDAWRTATLLELPLVPPPSHPFRPLLALRAASTDLDEEQRWALVTRLWSVAWGGERHPEGGLEEEAVVARLADEVGLDGAAVVAAAGSDEVKARLREQTERAVGLGVFGVPSLLVDGEIFWGFDSLGHVGRRLRGEDPIDRADLQQWASLPATAQRRAPPE